MRVMKYAEGGFAARMSGKALPFRPVTPSSEAEPPILHQLTGDRMKNMQPADEHDSFTAQRGGDDSSLMSPVSRLLSLLSCLILLTSVLAAQSGGQFTITKSVIAGGGGRVAGGVFTVDGTIGQAVAGGPSTGGTFSITSGFWGGGSNSTTVDAPFDFDGDGKTDIGIFRASGGEWWIQRSSTSVTFAAQFGLGTDRLVPADFTGDNRTDIAVWRPTTGDWYVLRSEDFSFFAFPFGTTGDIPVPADYDGDGRADPTVFRPSTGVWFIQRSTGGFHIEQFGQNGDFPVPADYDGDGRADIAIYRTAAGQWWMNRTTAGVLAVTFGNSQDKPTPGDFTGDRRADVAFWRPSDGFWYVLRSEDLSFFAFPFGTTGDVAAPGDYDGDGRTDATVFRPAGSVWFSRFCSLGWRMVNTSS
jgi:hypothetical protein